ncbi:MAG TPA: type IV secretion system protein [Steroidobacteraceae bacterium]|jgi:type IV secretion system protein VirB5|nr:type IV secretion system protein [Steroidobacteraceae bacterium]
MSNRNTFGILALATLLTGSPAAHAQFAVIDVASLTQLISEVQTLEQQLATAHSQLSQAQSEYQSITGARGMQQLLAGTSRNYLPPDWGTLQSALHGPGGYPTLAGDVQGALRATVVLSATQLAALPPAAGTQLQNGRQSAALLQSVSHEALANSSGRFAAMQQLIDAIGRADDQKSILELQARIAAEQGMLQNENTKLQVLYRGLQAQQWANAQTVRELTVAGHGQFAGRFQPHP